MADSDNIQFPSGNEQPADQASQANRQQLRVQVDEREMSTSYANAFRTNATSDEVFVDFGLNMVVPNQGQQSQPNQPAGQLMLKFNDRVILNYKTAKRLAITLGQVIRAHEERFGEIKLEQQSGSGESSNR